MSDAVYDDVIRTESERVEMMVAIYESADCVRDHHLWTETNTHQLLQQTGSDCVKNRSSRAAVVCLVLLCVLLLTAVIVLCVHIHTNYTQETHQLLTKITNLTEERNQILTNNTNLIQLNKKLTQEKNELLKRFNETDGWFYHQSSFYYISSEWNNWNESRRYCTERGADLIIINNKEEQNFVMEFFCNSGVWIGLTDIGVEGLWKWVDGSTLTSGFWSFGEPNGNRRKNCVVSYSSVWNDYPCNYLLKWICEKKILQ